MPGKPCRRLLLGTLTALLGAAPALWAQQDSAAQSTAERLDALDQKVRILERLRELERDSLAAAARSRVSVSAGAGGFSIRSADGAFQMRFRGYLQTDARFFNEDSVPAGTADNLLIRRARPILEATLFKYVDVRLMPDFANSSLTLFDGYSELKLSPALAARFGKYKPPIGLERLQSATDIRFAERGLPTNLAPSRDLGFQLSGVAGRGLVGYEAGVFNGVADLASTDNDASDKKELVGRVMLYPFAPRGAKAPVDLAIGIAASTGEEQGSSSAPALPGYRSPSQQTVFRYAASTSSPATGTAFANGRRTRVAPQAYLNLGRLGLLGEYTLSRQAVRRDTGTATLAHRAWQVSGGWFLTGEKSSFRSVSPRRVFDPGANAWGALELVARYGELDLDDDAFPFFANPASSVTRERAFGVGANWYLARGIRISVNYEHTSFDGGAPAGDRPSEDFVVTRFQTAW